MSATTPPRIHAYWTGPAMPEHLAGYLQRWKDLHPDWTLTVWTDDTLPPLRHREYWADPGRWSPRSSAGQYRANLVRYELLHRYGGVWVDCDLEPLRPIDLLIEHADGRLIVAWEKQGRWLNNALMAAPPQHPALAAILDGIPRSIRRQPHRRSNIQTGAKYITPILVGRADVLILDQHLVYPYSWSELGRAGEEFPDAWAVHRWHHAATAARSRRRP